MPPKMKIVGKFKQSKRKRAKIPKCHLASALNAMGRAIASFMKLRPIAPAKTHGSEGFTSMFIDVV